MQKRIFQIFILLAAVFGIFSAVNAAEITVFSFDDSAKTIQASGVCGGHSAAIHIFAASSTEPFYMAGSECADGKFNFQDDLSYWKILPGEYRLAAYDANSPLSNPSEENKFVVPEAPPEQYLPPELLNNSTSTEETEDVAPENFFTRVLDALLNWFADAVLKIKELVVQKISVSNLCVGETCVNEGDLKGFLKEKKDLDPDINEPPEEKGGGEQKERVELVPVPAAEPSETATSSESIGL